MPTILSYLTGFGLASGAGAKASIPVLLLGIFHYTDYFELSEKWLWIASPPVMAVLAVLVIVEIIIDSSPDLGEYADVAAYLPKAVAGFIAFAAATGQVDDSLIELSASGLLGSATATGAHWLRTRIRRPFRQVAESAHEGLGKLASLGEAGVSAGIAGTAVTVPLVSLVLVGGVGAGALVVSSAVDNRRVPCTHCGEPIRPGALVCVHCKREQGALGVEADPADAGQG